MNKVVLGVTIVLTIVGLFAAACAPAAQPPAPAATAVQTAPTAAVQPTTAPDTSATTAPAGGPKPGGQVVVGHGQEPDRFWQPFSGLTVSHELGNAMNLPLLQINDKLEFIPRLLTEVPTTENGLISADGLSITFPLRDDVMWHDGEPFTSADVKFTADVMMMEGTDVTGRTGWDKIVAVETPDEHTAIFKFSEIDAPFLSRLSLVSMLPEHILKDKTAEEINKDPWFRAPVGTGPFMFKEWVPGDHVTLVKNPNYFEEGKPYLDTLIWKIVPDSNALVNQVQTGDVDVALRVSDTDAVTVKGFGNVGLVSSSTVSPWLIWVQNEIPGLKDKAVRQSLSYALDRKGIAEQLLKGLMQPAEGWLPSDSWAYNPEALQMPFDIDKANQLLDEAGWVKGADGIREKDGVKLSFKISNIAGQQQRIQILTQVIAGWKKIGVDAQIDLVDVGTLFGDMLPNHNFQMAYSYSGLTADPDMSVMFFCPENDPGGNYGNYCNPKVDEFLKAQLGTFDLAKRKEALSQAQALIAEDVPYLYLGWRADHTAVNNRVKGYLPAPGYIELWNALDWYVEE